MWKISLPPQRGGVDLFLQAAKANVALLQVGDGVDQVAQGATESVELPDNQGVAWSQLVKDLHQLGSLVESAAGSVGEDPIAAGCLERVELQVRMLIGRRHARITEQVQHGGSACQKVWVHRV